MLRACLPFMALLFGCAPSLPTAPYDAGADGAQPLRFELGVRVHDHATGRGIAGARVRVEGARGEAMEPPCDGSGRCPLTVSRDDGPWSVTAFAPGHTVVSLAGVCGPLSEPVSLAAVPYVEAPSSASFVRFEGTITGASTAPPGDQVDVYERGGALTFAFDGRFSGWTRRRSDVPLQCLALAYRGGHLVNYVLGPELSPPNADARCDLTLPTSPVPMGSSRLSVRVAPGGLLVAGPAWALVDARAIRLRAAANDRIFWTSNDYPAQPSWHNEGFTLDLIVLPPPLSPDRLLAAFRVPAQGLFIEVEAQADVARDIVVPQVRAFTLSGDDAERLTLLLDAPAYDGNVSLVLEDDALNHTLWTVTARCGNGNRVRTFPQLPTGASLRPLLSARSLILVTASIAWATPERLETPAGVRPFASVRLTRTRTLLSVP